MSKLEKANKEHSDKFLSTEAHELPDDKRNKLKKAKKLEGVTIVYLISVVIVMYLTLGSSQAMKTAWLEDTLSIIPALVFLIAYSIYDKRPPDHKFQYGFHKVFTVAFLIGSFALLLMGLYTVYDSAMALIRAEHPTIGNTTMFGHTVWMGWLMIAALLWSFIPALFLGRRKLSYAKELHNKILFTDANTQKADWQTAGAAIAGIIGVGFGIWWFDSAAALFIALNIAKDGFLRTKGAITDIMEQVPTEIDEDTKLHSLDFKIYEFFKELDWVKDVRVRLRENGAVFFGEVFIIPADHIQTTDDLIGKIEQSYKEIRQIDWKIHDLTIQPVKGFKKVEKV
ncbi:MAG: cation transporter [Bacteroidia bacterium]